MSRRESSHMDMLRLQSERQALYLAATEPPIDSDGDTAKLEPVDAPLAESDDDELSPSPPVEVEPIDRPAADEHDGDLLPFEE